jgi:predicted kinase
MTQRATPTLYITMGLPASGKTYFSQRFAKDLGVFFLNVDSLRLAIVDYPQFTPSEHKMVYGTAEFLAEQHLAQGMSFICNGNYHFYDRRTSMQKMAERYNAEYKILWIDVPYEVAKERILTREHEIPKEKEKDPWIEVLDRMRRNFQNPHKDEPFIKIDGTISYDTQLNHALRQLAKLD